MNNLMKNNMMAQAKEAIEKINKKIKFEKEKKQKYIKKMFNNLEVSNANMQHYDGEIEKTNTEIERLNKMKEEILKGSDRAAADTAEDHLERVLAEIVAAGGKDVITGARRLRLAPVSVGGSRYNLNPK